MNHCSSYKLSLTSLNSIIKYFLLLIFLSSSIVVFSQTHTISGIVYLDHNGDGIQNGSDYGHPILRVNVVRDDNQNGNIDPTDLVLGTPVTNQFGYYTTSFNAWSGTYLVQVELGDLDANAVITTPTVAVPSGNATNVNLSFRGEPVACVSISDRQAGQASSAPDVSIYVNRISGISERIGVSGSLNVEAVAFNIGASTLFAANADRLGRISTFTGSFIPYPNSFGTANGSVGTRTLNDVDGLSFDPLNSEFYGVSRIKNAYDILFKIDTISGQYIPDAFGTGVDYVVCKDAAETLPYDVDDIAINPVNSEMYAVFNDNTNNFTKLAIIDKTTGVATVLNDITFNGSVLRDVEGFGFTNFGLLTATTGEEGTTLSDNSFYTVDLTTGIATRIGNLENAVDGSVNGVDYEGSDCLIARNNLICGTVFQDNNEDGLLTAGEAGLPNVDLTIWIDINKNGVVDPADRLATTITTGPNGEYEFITGSNVQFIIVIDQSTLPLDYDLTTAPIQIVDLSGAVGGTENCNIDFGAIKKPDFVFDCDAFANHEVEVIGSGVVTGVTTSLSIANTNDVDSIILEAVMTGGAAPNFVEFNSGGQTFSTPAQEVVSGSNTSTSFRYYRRAVAVSSLVTLKPPTSGTFESFTAYVFRKNAPTTQGVSGQFTGVYLFVDNYTTTLPIPISANTRDVEVVIPITGLSNTPTTAIITLTTGGVTQSFSVTNPNQGNSLNLTTFVVQNVPATATNVIVSIASPFSSGDAFIVSGIIATSGCGCPEAEIVATPAGGIICLDESMTFTATPQQAVTIYNWNFGAGATPTSATGLGPHTVAYTTPGNKQVTLSVTENLCSADIDTFNVVVNPVPEAEIVISPDALCTGGNGYFEAKDAGPGAIYNWNFGSGANPPNATGNSGHNVSYNTPGIKYITLIVELNGCVETTIDTLEITQTPIAAIANNSGPVCQNTTALFQSGSISSGVTYTWNFGLDATPQTATSFGPHFVSWTTIGTKEITLIAERNTCFDYDTLYFNVLGCNNPPIAVDDYDTTFVNVPVSGSSLPNDSDPDGDNLIYRTTTLIPPTNGSVVLSSNGDYTYTPNPGFTGQDQYFYEVCDDGTPVMCDSAYVYIVIGSCPTVVSILGPPQACGTTQVTFSAGNAGPGTSYTWSFGAGATPSTTTGIGPHQVTYSFAGSKTVDLSVNNQCTNSTSRTIQIDSIPTGSLVGPTSACAGDQNQYSVTNVSPNATFVWDFDTGATPATSTDASPLVSWSTVGIKTVTLTISLNGCTQVLTQTMNITGGVFAAAGPDVTICDGGTVQLGASPSGPPGASYVWVPSIGLNNPNVANPFASPTDTTTYTLYVTLGSCVSTSQITVNVDVNSVPFAYAGPDNFTCEGQAVQIGGTTLNPSGPAGAFYSWSPIVGLDNPYSANPMASPLVNTTYTLTVEKNGCFKQDQVLVEVVSSIQADAGPTKRHCIGTNPGVTIGSLTNNPFANYQWTPVTDLSNPNDPTTFATPTVTTIYQLCATRYGCTSCDEVVVVVEDCNAPPIAFNDDNSTLAVTPVPGNVLTNDIDPNDNNLVVNTVPVTDPANGVVVVNADGSYVYTPNPDFIGTDVWEYEVCEVGVPNPECTTAIVVIEVRDNWVTNDLPIALDDGTTTKENQPVSGEVLSNDGDPDKDNLTINTTPVNSPLNGSVIINPDGTYTYTPNPGFVGFDFFTYRVCDDGIPTICDVADVVIYVEADLYINDAPIVIDDYSVTAINGSISGNVTDNDIDPDLDVVTVDPVPTTPASNGTVVLDTDGTYSYTPNPGFTGTDSFEYTICDNGTPVLCSTGTVTIDVLALNNLPPIVMDEFETTSTNLSVDLDLISNDGDPDNDQLAITLQPTVQPTNGVVFINPDGTARYLPNLNFKGTDSFEYEVCDNVSGCTNGVVNIIVFDSGLMGVPPIAADDHYSTTVTTPVNGNLLVNDVDPDNGTISINPIPVNPPSNGSLTMNANGFYTYTPNIGFVGTDQFQYEVCDANVGCDQAIVFIEVYQPQTVNNPPVAGDDNNITMECTPIVGDVLSNDIDMEGDPIAINTTLVTPPTNGTAVFNQSGTYTYAPQTGFEGTDSFEYEVCDDEGNCDQAIVEIVVIPAPPQPAPSNYEPWADDDGAVTFGGVPINGDVSLNDWDPENTQLTWGTTPVVGPAHGVLTINADGTYYYVPDAGYIGPDQFLYEVCDAGSPIECDTASVYLTIFAYNNNPIGINDDNVTYENVDVYGKVFTNDFDPDGNLFNLYFAPITYPSNGNISLNSDGTYLYRPDSMFVGTDFFIYRICDNGTPGPKCTDIRVDLIVLPLPDLSVNNAPLANNDDNLTYINGSVDGTVISNDYDADGNLLTVNTTPVVDPSAGTVVLNSDGTYTYTPLPEFTGQDQFEYEVCDNGSPILCTTATVYIDVIDYPFDYDGNSPPFASDDFGVTELGQPITIKVLENDNDPDNDPLIPTPQVVAQPANGLAVYDNVDGFTYIPNSGFFGTDYFIYEICDNFSGCSKATVYILVNGAGCVTFDFKVWLEGPYDAATNKMTTFLNLKAGNPLHRGLLPGQTPLNIGIGVLPTPAGQPYSIAPWSYPGTEGDNWTDADYDQLEALHGADVVDWVLLSFRANIYKTSEFYQTAALLLEDGRIISVDECGLLVRDVPANVYVVVEHRNHMGIMNQNPLVLTGDQLSYDYRTQNSYVAPGGVGSKEIQPGVWAMFGSDGDQTDFPSYDLKGSDKILWRGDNGFFDVYTLGDFDLNGDVNGKDKFIWEVNNGVSSRVPKN